MDLRRLRAGEYVVALGGAVLLVSLFLGWYEGATGWEAFTVTDVLLGLFALAALALLPITATQRVPAIPLALDALIAIAGKLAALLILIRIVFPPGEAEGIQGGAWLGFLGAALIIAGGWIAMRDERLSGKDRVTDLTGRPAAESPVIESMPAP